VPSHCLLLGTVYKFTYCYHYYYYYLSLLWI